MGKMMDVAIACIFFADLIFAMLQFLLADNKQTIHKKRKKIFQEKTFLK